MSAQLAARGFEAASGLNHAQSAGSPGTWVEQEATCAAAHRSSTASTETDSSELHTGQQKRKPDAEISSGGHRGRPRLRPFPQVSCCIKHLEYGQMAPPRHAAPEAHMSGAAKPSTAHAGMSHLTGPVCQHVRCITTSHRHLQALRCLEPVHDWKCSSLW